MEINISKTKAMVVNRKDPVPEVSISVEGKPIQQVSSMVYLGYMATEDGRCEADITRRLTTARSSFENMLKVLTSRCININLRQCTLRCYMWSTLLYGAETWTLSKRSMNKLEAFEMWTYRRMLKLSWIGHRSNGEVLQMLNIHRSLLNTIKKRILTYFGHEQHIC